MTDSTASGWPRSSGGTFGQVLDLAHDVVAEVADEPGVQGGQVGQLRGVEGVEGGLEGGQHAGRPAHPAPGGGVEVEGALGAHPAALRRHGGQRAASDERVAPPPLAALDRLEEEAGAAVAADDAEEGGDRGDGVGHELAPDRHQAVLGGQGAEPVEAGTRPAEVRLAHGSATASPKARKKQLRLPVWHAPRPSWSTITSSASPSQS